jgi:hypothetical protein
MKLYFGWGDLWGIYQESDTNNKKALLKELDLKFLQHKSYKVQVEVLAEAPQEIVKSLQSILLPKTRIKLGLSTPDIEKKLTRIFMR